MTFSIAFSFQSVRPIQFHLCLGICYFYFISFFHNSSFVVVSGQLTFTILRRCRFTKLHNFLHISWVTHHVSHPYNRIDFTLELKILSFVHNEISLDFQTSCS
jgi:hypothetical protein